MSSRNKIGSSQVSRVAGCSRTQVLLFASVHWKKLESMSSDSFPLKPTEGKTILKRKWKQGKGSKGPTQRAWLIQSFIIQNRHTGVAGFDRPIFGVPLFLHMPVHPRFPYDTLPLHGEVAPSTFTLQRILPWTTSCTDVKGPCPSDLYPGPFVHTLFTYPSPRKTWGCGQPPA